MGDTQSTIVVVSVIVLVVTAMISGSAFLMKIEKEKGKHG